MTSLEMVEFINSQRGDGEAELRHDHFMAKVPKVLGEAAPKFSGTAFKRWLTFEPSSRRQGYKGLHNLLPLDGIRLHGGYMKLKTVQRKTAPIAGSRMNTGGL